MKTSLNPKRAVQLATHVNIELSRKSEPAVPLPVKAAIKWQCSNWPGLSTPPWRPTTSNLSSALTQLYQPQRFQVTTYKFQDNSTKASIETLCEKQYEGQQKLFF